MEHKTELELLAEDCPCDGCRALKAVIRLKLTVTDYGLRHSNTRLKNYCLVCLVKAIEDNYLQSRDPGLWD